MLKPSCETRCCIRTTTIAKSPCTHCLQHAACGKRKPAPFRPRSDTWEQRPIRSEENARAFRPAGFCLRRKNRSFCPPVAKTSDSCPLTRYVMDLFNDYLLMESHFSQKPHFYGLYPAKNRSSCPEAAKMNDSSQFTKENARFSHDGLKQASFALQQSGSPLARIAFNMQLRQTGASAISPTARYLGTKAYPAKRKRPLQPRWAKASVHCAIHCCASW